MRAIYLIGFMGSGKTSVATCLSKKLAIPLYDTDKYIEDYYNTSIPTIFSQKGEKVFREYETNVLKKLPTGDVIVSTGGGIIERRENMEWMTNHGLVIYLDTNWDEIVKRLKDDQNRPLWNDEELDKQKLFERRLPVYKHAASINVTTNQKSPEQIADEILRLVE